MDTNEFKKDFIAAFKTQLKINEQALETEDAYLMQSALNKGMREVLLGRALAARYAHTPLAASITSDVTAEQKYADNLIDTLNKISNSRVAPPSVEEALEAIGNAYNVAEQKMQDKSTSAFHSPYQTPRSR